MSCHKKTSISIPSWYKEWTRGLEPLDPSEIKEEEEEEEEKESIATRLHHAQKWSHQVFQHQLQVWNQLATADSKAHVDVDEYVAPDIEIKASTTAAATTAAAAVAEDTDQPCYTAESCRECHAREPNPNSRSANPPIETPRCQWSTSTNSCRLSIPYLTRVMTELDAYGTDQHPIDRCVQERLTIPVHLTPKRVSSLVRDLDVEWQRFFRHDSSADAPIHIWQRIHSRYLTESCSTHWTTRLVLVYFMWKLGARADGAFPLPWSELERYVLPVLTDSLALYQRLAIIRQLNNVLRTHAGAIYSSMVTNWSAAEQKQQQQQQQQQQHDNNISNRNDDRTNDRWWCKSAMSWAQQMIHSCAISNLTLLRVVQTAAITVAVGLLHSGMQMAQAYEIQTQNAISSPPLIWPNGAATATTAVITTTTATTTTDDLVTDQSLTLHDSQDQVITFSQMRDEQPIESIRIALRSVFDMYCTSNHGSDLEGCTRWVSTLEDVMENHHASTNVPVPVVGHALQLHSFSATCHTWKQCVEDSDSRLNTTLAFVHETFVPNLKKHVHQLTAMATVLPVMPSASAAVEDEERNAMARTLQHMVLSMAAQNVLELVLLSDEAYLLAKSIYHAQRDSTSHVRNQFAAMTKKWFEVENAIDQRIRTVYKRVYSHSLQHLHNDDQFNVFKNTWSRLYPKRSLRQIMADMFTSPSVSESLMSMLRTQYLEYMTSRALDLERRKAYFQEWVRLQFAFEMIRMSSLEHGMVALTDLTSRVTGSECTIARQTRNMLQRLCQSVVTKVQWTNDQERHAWSEYANHILVEEMERSTAEWQTRAYTRLTHGATMATTFSMLTLTMVFCGLLMCRRCAGVGVAAVTTNAPNTSTAQDVTAPQAVKKISSPKKSPLSCTLSPVASSSYCNTFTPTISPNPNAKNAKQAIETEGLSSSSSSSSSSSYVSSPPSSSPIQAILRPSLQRKSTYNNSNNNINEDDGRHTVLPREPYILRERKNQSQRQNQTLSSSSSSPSPVLYLRRSARLAMQKIN